MFIGDQDEEGKPNGLVRCINEYGEIFEGMMDSEGQKDGWGVQYDCNGEIIIGVWKNNNYI